MNNTTTETTVPGAIKAYMLTKTVSDMSKDPRSIEELLDKKGIPYQRDVLISRDGDPKVRVITTVMNGWKRTILASLEGPGLEGAYCDQYDYYSGVVSLTRQEWLDLLDTTVRKYA